MNQIQYPSMNNLFQAREQGMAAGQNALNQRTSAEAGGALAKGDYKGARDAFFKGGQVDQGMQIQSRIQAMNDQERAKTARITELIGNVAMYADTPEKWAQAVQHLQQRGMDVSQWADFGKRDMALAETGKTLEMIKLENERRKGAKDSYIKVDKSLYNPQTNEWLSPPAAPGADGAMPKALTDALARQDAKQFGEFSSSAQGAGEMQTDIDALKAARAGTNYEGSWLNNALGRTIGRNIGGDPFGVIPSSKDVQAIDTIDSVAGRLVQNAAKNLKGALSDKDIDLLYTSVPGSGMTDAAAASVIAGVEAGTERAQVRATMYDAWLQAYGNGRGFNEAWGRFTNENPVFRGVDGNGILQINPNANSNWERYMQAPGGRPGQPSSGNRPLPPGGFPAAMGAAQGQEQPRPNPAASGGAQDRDTKDMSDDELMAILRGGQ